jgi:hypothetical protein
MAWISRVIPSQPNETQASAITANAPLAGFQTVLGPMLDRFSGWRPSAGPRQAPAVILGDALILSDAVILGGAVILGDERGQGASAAFPSSPRLPGAGLRPARPPV